MTIFGQIDSDLLYPADSDGKPMAENTEQYRWIVLIKENLEILFANKNNVLIVGDLLWYPVRCQLIAPTAPPCPVWPMPHTLFINLVDDLCIFEVTNDSSI